MTRLLLHCTEKTPEEAECALLLPSRWALPPLLPSPPALCKGHRLGAGCVAAGRQARTTQQTGFQAPWLPLANEDPDKRWEVQGD